MLEGAMLPDRHEQYNIRESARQRQLERTNLAVRQVLKEIDQAGILRSISWDGARCLLLILPLTECKFLSDSNRRKQESAHRLFVRHLFCLRKAGYV